MPTVTLPNTEEQICETFHEAKTAHSKTLWSKIFRASAPAYVFPWLTSYASGLLTGNPGLQAASWSSIAMPSAAAAAFVIVVLEAPASVALRKVRNTMWIVLACGAVCASVAEFAELIWHHFFGGPVELRAILSSAIGAVITAAIWAWPRRLSSSPARANFPDPEMTVERKNHDSYRRRHWERR